MEANSKPSALLDEQGSYRKLVTDKCGSLWFSRFVKVLQSRMGQIWKLNKALLVVQIVELVQRAEARYKLAVTKEEKNVWSCFMVYATLSYVLSLRGTEGFMIDLASLNKHKDRNDGTYFTVGLMGRIKGRLVPFAALR